jgi:release factor glutamine methyltransferase
MGAAATAAGTRAEALAAAREAFAAAGIADPRLDAEVLLAAALDTQRAALATDPGAPVDPAAGRAFAAMVRRRLRREPVAYVLGRRGFRRLELAVDGRALIPRPETELLVEVALERSPRRALDLGTGSGAIALALAEELPGCEVVATDTSPAALALARANAARLGLGDRVELLAGTIPPGREFDLVLANLPYVSEAEWPGLEPEVTEWEPREALLAGPDGLDAYRALFADPRRSLVADRASRERRSAVVAALAPGGAVAVEVGRGQAGAVAELMRGAGLERTGARRDLAGIERVVVGER